MCSREVRRLWDTRSHRACQAGGDSGPGPGVGWWKRKGTETTVHGTPTRCWAWDSLSGLFWPSHPAPSLSSAQMGETAAQSGSVTGSVVSAGVGI